VQLNIRDELNQNEYQRYMDRRFNRIFITTSEMENNSVESDEERGKGMIQWNAEEKAVFIELLKTHGRDWAAIAEALPRKSDK